MKVLVNSTSVIPSPPPSYGGIELIVWLLADGLSQLGHDVILSAPEGSIAPNPKVKVIPNVARMEMFNEMAIPRNLEKIIEEFKPDIINDHSHMKRFYYTAKEKELPYIPTSHNITIPQFPENKLCLTTLSKRHSQYIYETTGVKSRYAHNGLDIGKFKVVGRKHHSNSFIYLARPNPEKGILQAIDFCLKNKIPLDVICGSIPGDGKEYLLEVARACTFHSCVTFHGEKSHEDKNDMVARAKAMLFFPQVHEAFGLNAIECQLSGIPLITNDMGAMPELVEDGKTGFVVPTEKNPDGTDKYVPYPRGWMSVVMDEDKIKKAVEDIPTLDSYYIRTRAVDQFSHIAMAKRYETIYNAYLKGERW